MAGHKSEGLRDAILTVGVAVSTMLTGCASLTGGSTGIVDGQLHPCPPGPHCVSSDETRVDYRISALKTASDADAVWRALRAYVIALPRTEVVDQQTDYLHLTSTSRWLRFTDDVEFLLRKKRGEIAMRSSSRVGYYDFGVNRERLESIRTALRAQKLVE